jgi:hypothetical protein
MKKGLLSIAIIASAINIAYCQTVPKPVVAKPVLPAKPAMLNHPSITNAPEQKPDQNIVPANKPQPKLVLPPKPIPVVKPTVAVPTAKQNAAK